MNQVCRFTEPALIGMFNQHDNETGFVLDKHKGALQTPFDQ
jgi:hypothetical protein